MLAAVPRLTDFSRRRPLVSRLSASACRCLFLLRLPPPPDSDLQSLQLRWGNRPPASTYNWGRKLQSCATIAVVVQPSRTLPTGLLLHSPADSSSRAQKSTTSVRHPVDDGWRTVSVAITNRRDLIISLVGCGVEVSCLR